MILTALQIAVLVVVVDDAAVACRA